MTEYAASAAGDRVTITGNVGEPCEVRLPGDYFSRLRKAAEDDDTGIFGRAEIIIPHSVLTSWGPVTVGDGSKGMRGPVDSIVVAAITSQDKRNPPGAFAGVSNNDEALRVIANEFIKDLFTAVNGVATKYNKAIAELAGNANVPEHIELRKKPTSYNAANLDNAENALSALTLQISGARTMSDARRAQEMQGTKITLERDDMEEARREYILAAERGKKGKKDLRNSKASSRASSVAGDDN